MLWSIIDLYSFGDAIFYKWCSKCSGMDISGARKLKAFETDNAKLKKLLAEQMMDVSVLRAMLGIERANAMRSSEHKRNF